MQPRDYAYLKDSEQVGNINPCQRVVATGFGIRIAYELGGRIARLQLVLDWAEPTDYQSKEEKCHVSAHSQRGRNDSHWR